jgi:hypothetical protein
LFHAHRPDRGSAALRDHKNDKRENKNEEEAFHGITCNPPVNVVTLFLVSCRITVRAPSEAVGVAASVKATPGNGGLSVDWIDFGLLTVRSFGPLTLIVIDADKPVPNISTVIVDPSAMVPPVFEAELLLAPAATVPKAIALGFVPVGATTAMSAPEVV